MKHFILILAIHFSFASVSAQHNIAVSGRVLSNHVPVASATIAIGRSKTVSDSTGNFSIATQSGTVTITVSHLGFKPFKNTYVFQEDSKIEVELTPITYELDEAIVVNKKQKQKVGYSKLDQTFVKSMPSLLGEPDALKAIQLSAGILSGGEGSSGFFVRGGGNDQNLYMYDEAHLYYVMHMLGLMSVFSSDVVKSVSIYKGGFPAKYGGRLSSVVNVETREADTTKEHVSAGLGLVASHITYESPMFKNKAGILISGRRTYADLFTNLINSLNKKNPEFAPIPAYHFYDLNLKFNYQISQKCRFFISAYNGNDHVWFTDKIDYKYNWGNTMADAGLRVSTKRGGLIKSDLIFTRYEYRMQSINEDYNLRLKNRISDAGFSLSYLFPAVQHHNFQTGLKALQHYFIPKDVKIGIPSLNYNYTGILHIKAAEGGAYLQDEWKLSQHAHLNYGLRVSAYKQDSAIYLRPEPRVALELGKDSHYISLTYTRMNQYQHLVSNGMQSLPLDIWYPVIKGIPPQQSDMVSAGYSCYLFNKFQLTEEVYYKWMKDVIEYKEGADILTRTDVVTELVSGHGWSYGNEFTIKKTEGRLNGWLAYTLSWSKRQFAEKNFGNEFYSGFDRRHNINMVAVYTLSPRMTLSADWVYGTGVPVTLPVGRSLVNNFLPWTGGSIIVFQAKNSYRLPAYHHLDVALQLKTKSSNSWSFSIYNLYNRHNTYFIHYVTDRINKQIVGFHAEQVSLLPVILSLTYNF